MRRLGGTDLELLEQLFEQLPDCPFFAKDSGRRYVAANTAMARLCGVRRPRDLYGLTADAIFPPALAAYYEALDRQVLAGGRPLANRLDLSGGPGQPVWLLFTRTPVSDPEGRPVGVAAASRRLKPADRDRPTYHRIAKAVGLLESRPEARLGLDGLAAAAGVSKSQLERDFGKLFGMTPGAFLQQLRIERSLQLLETTMTIAQVAHACGYADHSAFTQRFRDTLGLTPSDYRARLAARGP
jgi:AraC-like DNA-binding protein